MQGTVEASKGCISRRTGLPNLEPKKPAISGLRDGTATGALSA